jgi:hypothetical protein
MNLVSAGFAKQPAVGIPKGVHDMQATSIIVSSLVDLELRVCCRVVNLQELWLLLLTLSIVCPGSLL